MVRATTPTNGEKADPTAWPTDITNDYLSQTETTNQNIASNLIFASGKAPSYDGSPAAQYRFVRAGTSPIIITHGIGQAPTGVVATVKGAQPYAVGVNWNATTITVYHNAAGSVTVSVIAWV